MEAGNWCGDHNIVPQVEFQNVYRNFLRGSHSVACHEHTDKCHTFWGVGKLKREKLCNNMGVSLKKRVMHVQNE